MLRRTTLLLLAWLGTVVFAAEAPLEKWVAPARESRKINPLPITPLSMKAGLKVYNDNCVSCHGEHGKGDGILVPSLPIKPANLSNPEVWKQADGELFWKITTGRQPMPSWGTPVEDPPLKEVQRWNVINYLRSTYGPAGGGASVAIVANPSTAPVTFRPVPAAMPATVNDITPDQYKAVLQQLLREHREMRAEIEQLKSGSGAMPRAATPLPMTQGSGGVAGVGGAGTSPAASEADVDEVQKQVNEIKRDLAHFRPGSEEFLIAGDAFVGFSAQRHNSSSFSAGVAPLFLWKPSKEVLYEAAFDLGLDRNADGSSSTHIDLTIADVSLLLTDWLTVGGGVFVTPFGVYHNHFDPPWINKFADDPLAFGDSALGPGSSLGIFARGAELIGNSKIVYDAYVVNGPNLITADPGTAGHLSFDNGTDLNSSKAAGGRIGFIPIPNLEAGYSVLYGRVQPEGFTRASALLQAVDINYRPDVPALGGTFDFRAEWIWSNVDTVTYDRKGLLGFGPIRFRNARDGGYVQLCYRPTHLSSGFIRNFELTSRFDTVRTPKSAPGGGTESRLTFGVNYWLNPQAVLKLDYEFDRRSGSLGAAQDALLFQLGLGL